MLLKRCKGVPGVWFSSPFLGTFFQLETNMDARKVIVASFRPLSRGLFSMHELSAGEAWQKVFVPFLGDFFSIACLRNPSPSALASAFAAGMGDRFIRHSPSEMKCRFFQAGRASAGICNEKIEKRNGGAAHKNMEPPRRFETSNFLV